MFPTFDNGALHAENLFLWGYVFPNNPFKYFVKFSSYVPKLSGIPLNGVAILVLTRKVYRGKTTLERIYYLISTYIDFWTNKNIQAL